jgi:hypothetical protein
VAIAPRLGVPSSTISYGAGLPIGDVALGLAIVPTLGVPSSTISYGAGLPIGDVALGLDKAIAAMWDGLPVRLHCRLLGAAES